MDPVLERYLNERGLSESSLGTVGASFDGTALRFPRIGLSGEVVGWKCRNLIDGRFYGEPAGISHSDTQPLMARLAWPAERLMICEGESDTMRLASSSLPLRYSADVVCIPGASAFPAAWVPLLRRYDDVRVFADGDDAGRSLPRRLASLVPGVRRVVLPEGEDVCSFLLKHEEDDLASLYEIAPIQVNEPAPLRKQSFKWDDAAADSYRDRLVRIVCEDQPLHRRGAELVGLCPFHDEKTASFSINPEKGLYRCFGCGAAGDVISYLKNKRDMSFGEAMRYLRGE